MVKAMPGIDLIGEPVGIAMAAGITRENPVQTKHSRNWNKEVLQEDEADQMFNVFQTNEETLITEYGTKLVISP